MARLKKRVQLSCKYTIPKRRCQGKSQKNFEISVNPLTDSGKKIDIFDKPRARPNYLGYAEARKGT